MDTDPRKTKIKSFIDRCQQPVVSALEVAQYIHSNSMINTNSPRYRETLNLMRQMQEEGLLGSAHFPGPNFRVWWSWDRVKV